MDLFERTSRNSETSSRGRYSNEESLVTSSKARSNRRQERAMGKAYNSHTNALTMDDGKSLDEDHSIPSSTGGLSGMISNMNFITSESKKPPSGSRRILAGRNVGKTCFVASLLMFALIGLISNMIEGVQLTVDWLTTTNNQNPVVTDGESLHRTPQNSQFSSLIKSLKNPQIQNDAEQLSTSSVQDGSDFYQKLQTNLASITEPFDRSREVPFFWNIGLTKSKLIDDLLMCTRLVRAGGFQIGTELELLQVMEKDGRHFLNVDLSTLKGIERAKQLRLSSSGLADIMISHHLIEIMELFSSTNRVRLIADFMHPQFRVQLTFLNYKKLGIVKENDLYEYAAGDHIEVQNFATRVLSGQLVGDVTEEHLEKAKFILKDKCIINMDREREKTVLRLEKFFDWNLDRECLFPDLYKVKEDPLSSPPVNDVEIIAEAQSTTDQANIQNEGENAQPPLKKEYVRIVKPPPPPPKRRHFNDEMNKAYALINKRNTFDVELFKFAETLFEAQGQLIASLP